MFDVSWGVVTMDGNAQSTGVIHDMGNFFMENLVEALGLEVAESHKAGWSICLIGRQQFDR